MLDSSEPISLFVILKNIGFLLKNAPFAAKKAEEHIKTLNNVRRRFILNRPRTTCILERNVKI
jgi:hypothetical protein